MVRSVAGCLLSLAVWPLLCLAQTSTSDTAFRITSRIVYVNVVVRDRQGHVVHGLAQRDFRLTEDGALQSIDYFDERRYPPGEEHGSGSAGSPVSEPGLRPSPTSEFTNVPAAGAASDSVSIILFDLLNTVATDQESARRHLLNFLGSLPREQKVALFVLTNRLQMVQSFTGSSDRLIEAARHIDPRNFGLIKSDGESMQDVDMFAGFAKAVGAGALLTQVEQAERDEKAGDEAIRARITIAALSELARATSGYPGRKNLLWLAESFPLAAGAQLERSKVESRSNLLEARETANLIADAQIAVYPINLLGLDTGAVGSNVSGASSVSAMGAPQGSLLKPQKGDTLRTQFTARAILRDQMEELAGQTGGEPFTNTNDFTRALQLSMEDGSNYYTLVYRPQNQKWDGRFRRIHLEVVRKGCSLSYRRGYFALDNTDSASSVEELNAALQPETHEWTMLLLHSKVEITGRMVSVKSALDAASLGLNSADDGHRRGRLLVRLVVFPDSQAAADHANRVVVSQGSAVLDLDFDAARYQEALSNGVSFTQQLKLVPGHYRLRLGVADPGSHRLGTLDMPVVVNP
ncbi:VWFA-related protein [Silvibacterium bohemicum]|uniref:VWFA-related protein n=1 Tax=Silvibacterium bohemicum TaxID=1577686 RepID=A0A841JTY3_9BACT|nr:VWA domain-containing protein [Silvibacterium bohemicum]MBB6143965.1 VWFA-related protein [Silvibacterium bohemicum]